MAKFQEIIKNFLCLFEYRGDNNEKTICFIFMDCCGLESEGSFSFSRLSYFSWLNAEHLSAMNVREKKKIFITMVIYDCSILCRMHEYQVNN